LLESGRPLTVDDDEGSLLWLLLSAVDGACSIPLELGLARMTRRCPVADDRCAVVTDDDDDVPVLTGMPSSCCLLATVTHTQQLL